MKIMIFIGIILLAVAASTMIQQHFARKISVNYIAMAIGIVLAIIPQTNSLIESFSSEVFMGLIVAPLLFFEGQRTRLYSVLRSWRANSRNDYSSNDCRWIWHIFKSRRVFTDVVYFGRNFNAY